MPLYLTPLESPLCDDTHRSDHNNHSTDDILIIPPSPPTITTISTKQPQHDEKNKSIQPQQQPTQPHPLRPFIIHRITSQMLFEPKLREFSKENKMLFEKYFDPKDNKIIQSDIKLPIIKMEFSIHLCSRRFSEDVKIVFPEFKPFKTIFAIPTFQPITADMTAFTFEAGELKDLMLANTMSILLTISEKVQKRAQKLQLPQDSYLFDGVEPSTGLPYITTGTSSVYSEVEGGGTLLRYAREQSGACCLLKHPKYGLSCYPSTFFIAGDFPIEELYQIFMDLSDEPQIE